MKIHLGKKMTVRPFDMANYLHSEKQINDYLAFAHEDGDQEYISLCESDAKRARAKLAQKQHLNNFVRKLRFKTT